MKRSSWSAAPALLAAVLAGCGGTPTAAPAAVTAPAPPAATAAATRPSVRALPVDGRVDYQLGGAYPPASSVRVVVRDRGATPAGRYDVCYVNAFQTQPGEAKTWAGSRRDLVLRRKGKPVADPDWPDEQLLDTSTAAKRARIAAVVNGWVDGCARRGFDAVEPDNLDSWTRSRGLLTKADNVALATLLTRHAHARGLAVAQKNTPELGRTGRTRVGFDFAVAEECQVYAECDAYTDLYGRRVVEIEYTDHPVRFYEQACRTRGAAIAVLLRDRDVVPRGQRGYRYRSC